MIFCIIKVKKKLKYKKSKEDKIELLDRLEEVSNNSQGIISLDNMRLNDLNNPNGSLSSEDIKNDKIGKMCSCKFRCCLFWELKKYI